MEEKRFYYPEGCGVSEVEWAKTLAFDLLQSSHGQKNARFFESNILNSKGGRILKKRTWSDFIREVRAGNFKPPQEERDPDEAVLKQIRMREGEKIPGVAQFKAANGRDVSVLVLRTSESHSSASRSLSNSQIKVAMGIQGKDLKERVTEFVRDPEISPIVKDTLKIRCCLGPKATTDLKIARGFSYEDIFAIGQTGVDVASYKEIKEEVEKRQIPMQHGKAEFQIKTQRSGENVKVINVRLF